jgi:hypothetical protein
VNALLLAWALAAARPDTSYAGLIARLSEPGGYFDTDNLVSNEQAYLHVVGGLRGHGVSGGAYLGVGPDQNFAYIVAVRPVIALIVDIRRDNMLLQLLFKALFTQSRNRMEYLCLLFGRPVPSDLAAWDDRELGELLGRIDATSNARDLRPVRRLVGAALRRFGVPLDSQDLAKIGQLHGAFMTQGLDIRLTTFNRPVRPDYPTYRELLLETDRDGRPAGYLVREDDFQYLKDLHRRDRIVPVVGDLGGDQAMPAIARLLRERRLAVSAFYTSNVEQYLLRQGRFERFARNVAALPHDARSVIIRSYFPYARPHPHQVAGYNNVQVLQAVTSFLDAQARGGYDSYFELVTRDVLDPRDAAPVPR